METKGDAYLRTVEQDLPIFVRWSLDIGLTVLAAAAAMVYIMRKLCGWVQRLFVGSGKQKAA